jgi:hypothetical protein
LSRVVPRVSAVLAARSSSAEARVAVACAIPACAIATLARAVRSAFVAAVTSSPDTAPAATSAWRR